ncbi:MAG: PAS domain-containing protein [Chloroflexi bacterium]|nr:PAS domain-containing protein [Chloroflexota bacterium]
MPGRAPRHDQQNPVDSHDRVVPRAIVFAAARGDPDQPPDATESERALASLPYLARVLVDADYAAITVIGAHGFIERMYVSGMTPDKVEQLGPPPSGKGVLGLMGTETSALRVDRISAHSRSVGFPSGHPPMESLLGVAVQRNGVHLANLYLTRRPGRAAFSVDDQKLVETAAQNVAAALENARLYTEEIRLRHEAEAERRRLVALAEAAPAGVIVIDAATDQILLVNEEVSKIFGFQVRAGITRGSLHGHFTYRRLDGSVVEPNDLPVYRAIREGVTIRSQELVFERKGQRPTPVWINAAPVKDDDGTVIAAIAVIQDISPLKALDEAKNDFLSMITHDLRTPLATLKGLSSEAVTRIRDDAELRDAVQAIDDEVDQMTELVGNLLDMSRIEAGAYPLEREECHLVDICGDAVRRARRSRQWATRELIVDVPATLPSVYADPGQLGRVVDNLIGNALKYSDSAVKITAKLMNRGREILVEVDDQGIGIPPNELGHLFDKFYRVTSAGRKGRGAGLGLAICKAIVGAHDGKIGVRSVFRQGSTFWFSLPVRD